MLSGLMILLKKPPVTTKRRSGSKAGCATALYPIIDGWVPVAYNLWRNHFSMGKCWNWQTGVT
jgi:hypothetical protein